MYLEKLKQQIILKQRVRGYAPWDESGVDNFRIRSDPTRIRIMRMWRRVFDIYADVDNPNPIVCGCRLGYGVSDIRRIWIIR
jgi:hypothetical protein